MPIRLHFPWQRIGAQVVLWGVLLAMVGVAGLITYVKQQAMRVKLDEAALYGRLRVRLPHGWKVSVGAGNGTGQDSVAVEESLPHGQPGGRRVSVWRQRIEPNGSLNVCWVSPVEFLLGRQCISGILTEQNLSDATRRGELRLEAIDIAGWPGTAILQDPMVRSQAGLMQRKQLIACAILPGAQALVVEVQGTGAIQEADKKLLEQMCGATAIAGINPPDKTGGAVNFSDVLTGGGDDTMPPTTAPSDGANATGAADDEHALIHLTVPKHFYLLANDDPNLLARQMVRDGSGDAWVCSDLIPCLFFDGDGEEEFRTLLVARQRDFDPRDFQQVAPNVWQADAGNATFPQRACLIAQGDGPALLVVCHGGLRATRDDLNRVLGDVRQSVKFGESAVEHARVQLPRMLRLGAGEAAELRTRGLETLLPRSEAQGWSLANEAENTDKIDWMELRWSTSGTGPTASWWGDRRTPFVYSAAPIVGQDRTHQQWNGYGNLSLYSTTWTLDHRQNANGPWLSTGAQPSLTLEHDQLRRLAAREEGGPAPMRSPTGFVPGPTTTRPAVTDLPLPPQYVPGGWLPLLIEHIAADTGGHPVLVRSESFVGCDGLTLNRCLTITLWRDPRSPLKTDEKGEAMDCITCSVNGTGRVSRWYFSRSGELRYIDFADWLRARQDPEKRIAEPTGLTPEQP